MDNISSERRSANMRAIRSKDTKPEMVVRRITHGLGYRYRLHRKDLPGTPDLVFKSRKKVIFVHGCYWHGHGCIIGGTGSKSNVEYWKPKISKNKERDATAIIGINNIGWNCLVIWECQIHRLDDLSNMLISFLGTCNQKEKIVQDSSEGDYVFFVMKKVQLQLGDDRFKTMGLLDLEKELRSAAGHIVLPGKTVLRERIHAYRRSVWPETIAKKTGSRFRW